MHECRNEDRGRAVSLLGIHKSDLVCSAEKQGSGQKVHSVPKFSPIFYLNGNFTIFILIDDMEPLWKLTCHGVLTGPLVLPDLMLKGTVEIYYIFSLNTVNLCR